MLTFGQVPAYQTDVRFDYGLSPDRRAFTLSFSDLQVPAEPDVGKSALPITSRVFCLVVPLEGAEERAEIAFHVSDGFVTTSDGATATAVFSVNGQTTIADFRDNADQSARQDLKLSGKMPPECRVCVFLLAGRDSTNPSSQAFLNVLTIEAEII